jgi:16S rRNA (adenine1518-N6/adenine1519-N6)-dimethyltransferase
VPPKSKLGQNFLRDEQAIRRIIAALGDCSGRTVVEIGPGRGAITQQLAAKAGRVVALEVDQTLASGLSHEFSRPDLSGGSNVAIEMVDVLAFDFEAASHAAGQPLNVVGNLPYYITSPILTKLANSAAVLDRAVLMVQREVADRVTAHPGSSEYGLLSATVQAHGPVEHLFTLPPGAFSPPPQVHSTVFRWRFSPRFEELGVERESFLAFLRRVFALKRKTLANNLRAAGMHSEAVAGALARAGIDAKARAEALGLEKLAELWRVLRTGGQMEGVIPPGEMTPSDESGS